MQNLTSSKTGIRCVRLCTSVKDYLLKILKRFDKRIRDDNLNEAKHKFENKRLPMDSDFYEVSFG